MDNKIQDVAFDNDNELKGTVECDIAQNTKIEEKRYCRKCKQWLPISYFEKYGIGVRHIYIKLVNIISKTQVKSSLILLVVN